MSMIKDFIDGFSNGFANGFAKLIAKDVRDSIHDEISKYIDEAIEKSIRKIFIIGVALSLVSVGSFLFLWGVASGIDKIFKMEGLGYMIFGVIGLLIGLLIYDRFNLKKKN